MRIMWREECEAVRTTTGEATQVYSIGGTQKIVKVGDLEKWEEVHVIVEIHILNAQ